MLRTIIILPHNSVTDAVIYIYSLGKQIWIIALEVRTPNYASWFDRIDWNIVEFPLGFVAFTRLR